MNDRLSEEQFRESPQVIIDGNLCEIAESSNREHIYVADMTLNVREAIQLRDWLNKVLP